MKTDDLVRAAAIGVAAAIVLAPYWGQIKEVALRLLGAAQGNATTIGRVAAAALVIAAAWGKVPIPSFGTGVVAVPVVVETPSRDMREYVDAISEAMRDAPSGDRLLWGSLWSKAAKVVEGDRPGEEQIVPDTRALRALNILVLDIGWKRIGGHRPGQYSGLRLAVERAIADTLGNEQKPLDDAMRAKVVEVYRAIAWAGMNRDG